VPPPVSLPTLLPGPDGYGVLPPGRWTCSRAEFEVLFLKAGGVTRAPLFADLDIYAEQQARHGLVVTSYWIGGSVVSNKPRPGDIDFTAVIDGSASTPDASHQDWLNPGPRWKHHAHPDIGKFLRVDGYAIVKVPDTHPLLADYYGLRGEWDDWWQRSRATGAALTKGYVEVVDW
jgi:hypothetical protein